MSHTNGQESSAARADINRGKRMDDEEWKLKFMLFSWLQHPVLACKENIKFANDVGMFE